ncbi:MAG: glycosyltransferase family 2 protein [Planctomycetales bacterium]|nr:glycosyltransferase family 2 protein [Planctomycetales bacterium]
MSDAFRLTVAIPLYNEQEVLPELLRRTLAVLDGLDGGEHQLLLVDDGSRDNTLAMLREAATRDPRVTVIALSRNFGHQAALSAAIEHAAGDAVVLMDGDLQDEPECIPDFVRAFREGYDVVYAIRTKRKEGWIKRACYSLFYRTLSWLSHIELPRDAGDFCLMSRRVVEQLRFAPERHRYLRGLRAWIGFRQVGIVVERGRRAAGRPKYTWRRLLRLAFDGIFSFSVMPLRAASMLGGVTILFSIAAAVFCVYVKFFGRTPPQGFTWLAVSMAFFAGVQLVFLGVIGEYVGRIYEEVKRRPLFIVDEIVNGPGTWGVGRVRDDGRESSWRAKG